MEKMNSEQLNAKLESLYFEQMIDEACNADLGFNNHFRRTMSSNDCIEAHQKSQTWNFVSEGRYEK